MIFQIIDDVLDVTATEAQLGKPAGHDLLEGVYTLPVLRTMALEQPEAAELTELLGRPLDAEQQQRALAIVREGDGVDSALETAREFAQRAADACGSFPDSPATAALAAAPAALLATVTSSV